MNILRVGIVGVGNIGSAHAFAVRSGKIRSMELVCLCDTDEKKRTALREQYPGISVYSDYKEMITREHPDAVIIATPHYSHAEIAIFAFLQGLHVLCEKPLGVDTGTAGEMISAAKRSGRVFSVMFNQRTDVLYAKARELLIAGTLGTPKRLVWIITNWYRTQSYYDSGNWRATWGGEGGGVLLNQAPHNLDLWQWIFGMPVRLRASCYAGKYHNIVVEDDAEIYAEYENGATAVFLTSTGEYPGTNRLEISGDRGKLVLEDAKLRLVTTNQHERDFCFTTPVGSDTPPCKETVYEEKPAVDGHLQILQNFCDAVLTGEPLISPGTEAINELMLSNAAYLSQWSNNEWISLPPDSERFVKELSQRVEREREKNKAISGEKPKYGYESRWQVKW